MQNYKSISRQIEDVLSGIVEFNNAQPAIQASCTLHFYQGACEVLSVEKSKRRFLLDKIPEKVRPYVENEVKRLWALRS